MYTCLEETKVQCHSHSEVGHGLRSEKIDNEGADLLLVIEWHVENTWKKWQSHVTHILFHGT